MSIFGDLFGDTGCSCARRAIDDELLGDLVCTSGEAEAGLRSVQQLVTFYDHAGRPAEFGPAVASILASFRTLSTALEQSSSLDAIGQNRLWCQAKDLGLQSDELTKRIGDKTGKAAPPPTPPPSSSGLGVLAAAITTAAALYAFSNVGREVLARRSRRE